MAGRLRALRVVHPFPSLVNSALVLALSIVAGATVTTASLLTAGMLGIQLCIGVVNDLADQPLDAHAKPWKPIPAGLVTVQTARRVALVSAFVAIVAPFLVSPAAAVMATAMLSCGLIYDWWLKPTIWAWACFSVAFAILPVYAWYGASCALPPLSQFLLPLAALAGPALQLSNGLVDLERDRTGGITTLATQLGRGRSLVIVAALLIVIYVGAWATLAVQGSLATSAAVVVATILAIAGITMSAARREDLRAMGWTVQVLAIALLAFGWLTAVQSL